MAASLTHTQLHLRPLSDAELQGPALADQRNGLDFEEFRCAVTTAARHLSDAGVGRGDVVAAVLSNRVELIITMYAAWALGGAFTPVDPAVTADEIAYQLADAQAQAVVTEPSTAVRATGVSASINADTILRLPAVSGPVGPPPAEPPMSP